MFRKKKQEISELGELKMFFFILRVTAKRWSGDNKIYRYREWIQRLCHIMRRAQWGVRTIFLTSFTFTDVFCTFFLCRLVILYFIYEWNFIILIWWQGAIIEPRETVFGRSWDTWFAERKLWSKRGSKSCRIHERCITARQLDYLLRTTFFLLQHLSTCSLSPLYYSTTIFLFILDCSTH